VSVGDSWRATNEQYLTRADATIEAGEWVGAWCALAAYLRQKTLRHRVERIEGPVVRPGAGANPHPEVWQRFMASMQSRPPSVPARAPIPVATPRLDGRSIEDWAATMIARVEAFRGEPMDDEEAALIRRCYQAACGGDR
jgi:hypothetical protein